MTLVLLSLGACSGGDSAADAAPACPASYTVGDSCLAEGLRCPYAGSMCGLKCTCSNNLWVCRTVWCECSCPCGRILSHSCELLECSAKATNTCPSVASKHCEAICGDAGPPDISTRDISTKDAGPHDSGPEAAPDSGPDIITPDIITPDIITPDQAAPDQAAPDIITPDQAAPDQAVPDQAVPDQTADLPPDMGPDSTPKDLLSDTPAPDQTADAKAPDQPQDAGKDAPDLAQDSGAILDATGQSRPAAQYPLTRK